MNKEIKYNFSEKAVIYGLATLVGMIITAVFVLLAAAFCLAVDLDDIYVSPIAGLCAGAGGLAAGFLSSKKIKRSGIINGAICGAVIYALILFISLFFSDNGFSLISVYHAAIVIVSSMIGGVLGVVSSAKRKVI